MQKKKIVEARKSRDLLEETVEREELLRSISHRLKEIEESFDLRRPVESEGSQKHEQLDVVEDESEVSREERTRSSH